MENAFHQTYMIKAIPNECVETEEPEMLLLAKKLMATIPFDKVEMGDLLFFPGHVGMYIRNGLFIHSTSHEGDEGVVLASLTPGHPRYRGDLRETMTDCGSIF